MTTSPICSLNIIMCCSTQKNISTKAISFPSLPTKTSNPLLYFIFQTAKRTFQTLEHTFHALKHTFQSLEYRIPLLPTTFFPRGRMKFIQILPILPDFSIASLYPHFVHSTCQNRSKMDKCIINAKICYKI